LDSVRGRSNQPLGSNLMTALFSLTAFSSAFLLFWVEPLFARMVLPLLGGSPAVWNTCLMYFQAALLGGYLYAHFATRYLGTRRQAVCHLALLACTLLVLPIAVPEGWVPPARGNPITWLVLLLTAALGAPFLILSATAPLLQRWFAGLEHPAAANPYVLYAASNAGSFCALLAFPTVLEPTLRLGEQSGLWSAGYLLTAGLITLCVAMTWRHSPSPSSRAAAAVPGQRDTDETPPAAGDRIRWVALAFVPSSVLLGVTTYLTTDVAAAPFLWVVPLALYLLTFVIVFARRAGAAPRLPVELHALLVTGFVLLAFWGVGLDPRWAYPLHLGVFTVTALVLHGELAATRPAPKHLTEFYLWLALGGALGGAFNALAAPVLFDSVAEYVPMVVAACFLRPSRAGRSAVTAGRLRGIAVAVLPALLLAVVAAWGGGPRRVPTTPVMVLASLGAAAITLTLRVNAALFGASLAAVVVAALTVQQRPQTILHEERSFFGAYRVVQRAHARLLFHGTTIHGAQFGDSARRLRPVTYYHPAGPAGQVFEALRTRLEGRAIGVIGLGAGSLLCYAEPGQTWTFFEIDPAVEAIARDPSHFTFLRDCPVEARVVLGDARLTLAREAPERFALLVLDAFSSDAIPVHLLTREALALYRRVLERDGALLLHISNRHLDLEPVVAALAADAGLVGLMAEHSPDPRWEAEELEYRCDWVLLTAVSEGAGGLAVDSRWRSPRARAGAQPWTDDYSNIFGAIDW
jgi:hypothetical protein